MEGVNKARSLVSKAVKRVGCESIDVDDNKLLVIDCENNPIIISFGEPESLESIKRRNREIFHELGKEIPDWLE